MTKINKKYIFWVLIFIALIVFFSVAKSAIRPFLISFVISYLLLPIVNKLEKLRLNRNIISGIIVFSIFVGILITASILLPFLYEKVASFLKEFITTSDNLSDEKIHKFSSMLHVDTGTVINIKTYLQNSISNLEKGLFNIYPQKTINSVIGLFATVIVMPIITFYMLKDWKKMMHLFYCMIPDKNRAVCKFIIHQIDKSIFAYLKGQVNVCLFFMIFYSILFYFTTLNLGFLLGLMVGLMIFIPYIGFFIGFIICLIVAFLQFGLDSHFISVALIFILGQLIDVNYTTPKFVGDKVGIHPVVIVFGLFVSTTIFGITGAILALPITTTSTILVRFLIQQYKSSYYYLNGNN